MTKKKTNSSRILRFAFAGLLLVAVVVGFFFQAPIEAYLNNNVAEGVITDEGVLFHFVDVGHGDATAIRFPDGKKMLVDAGPGSAKNKLADYIEGSFFKSGEPKVFDYFILTHAHEDHIGGAPTMFEKFQIDFTYLPMMYTQEEADELAITNSHQIQTTLIYKNTIAAVKTEPNSAYERFNSSTEDIIGAGYKLSFLTPNKPTYSNENNYSPILMLEYSGKRVFLNGDAEKANEDEYVELYGDMGWEADVLKVGHHGSKTSSTENFINSVKPKIAIILTDGKKYNDVPSDSVLSRLFNIGATVYRTDENGTILVSIYNGVIAVSAGGSPIIGVYISYYAIAGTIIVLAFTVAIVPELKLFQKRAKAEVKKSVKASGGSSTVVKKATSSAKKTTTVSAKKSTSTNAKNKKK